MGTEHHTPGILEHYTRLFVQRRDAFGRQRERSRLYTAHRKPLTDELLHAHLRGDLTLGLYSIQQDGLTRWSVIDSDEGLTPLYDIKRMLRAAGIETYIEQSRAGGHAWIFHQEPIAPAIARRALRPYAGHRELFPAGDVVEEEGLGLLLRAPLGVHRATMHRYPFLNDEGGHLVPGSLVKGQVEWLVKNIKRADVRTILPKSEPKLPPKQTLYESPIRHWVEGVSIRDVVGKYVQLNSRGVGHCPFPEHHKHADKHSSLQVFERTGKFWCYASQIGGDAAKFTMLMEKLTPREFYDKYCR